MAVSAGMMLLAISTTYGIRQLKSAQLAGAIANCRVDAEAAERFRKTASGSTVDPTTGVYSYIYNGISTWTNVATFNTTAATNLVPSTIWGTPYQVIGSGQAGECRFTAPVDMGGNPMDGVRTVVGAGSFQYLVYAPRAEDNSTSKRLRFLKSWFYEENTR